MDNNKLKIPIPSAKRKVEFKPFTTESLIDIKKRIDINNEVKRLEAEQMEIDEPPPIPQAKKSLWQRIFKKKKRKPKINANDQRRPNTELLTGNELPKKLINEFPVELTSVPIEELDDFYKLDYIFVVINPGKTIFRFSAKNALFILSPFNIIRRLAIYILTHPLFSAVVMLTILVNCIFMALPASAVPEVTEYIFTAIYTVEATLKILARGFILDNFSFLRDSWNWLDFIVISLAYATMLIPWLGNMSVLRTLRVLRALKTVAIVPGLKTIVDALLQSVIRLRDVMVLTGFILSVFALIGLQLYKGVLRQKCILKGSLNMTDEEYFLHVNNSDNWERDKNGALILCGNATMTKACNNETSTCIAYGDNPNSGYTSFDSYGYAMLAAFRLMTQDFWENLYTLVLTVEGPAHFFYFGASIFFGSFYLINLILAIVALSYREQQEKAAAELAALEEELKKEEEEKTASMNPHNEELAEVKQNMKSLDSCSLQLHNLPHDDPRRLDAGFCFISDPRETGSIYESQIDNSKPVEKFVPIKTPMGTPMKRRKGSTTTQLTWTNVLTEKKGYDYLQRQNQLAAFPYMDDTASTITFSTVKQSINTNKPIETNFEVFIRQHDDFNSNLELNDTTEIVIDEIDKSNEKLNESQGAEESPVTCKDKFKRVLLTIFCLWDCCPFYESVQKVVSFFILDAFVDLFITICILLNTLFMAMDHYDMNPTFAAVLSIGNYVFTTIFTAEAFFKIIALKPIQYFKEGWNIFDMIIVTLSLVELGLSGVKGLSVLRSFRLLRVFKLAKSWPTLNRLITIIGRTIGALGNLTFVLIIIIFIFAVMGMQLFGPQYMLHKDDVFGGEMPRWHFHDFFHSFLIVFRVLCGEWIESMWDCINVAGWPCVPFFLLTKIIRSLVVLNLFLALLLSSFGADSLKGGDDGNDDVNKIQEALDRISRFIRFLKRTIRRKICCFLDRKRKNANNGFSKHKNSLTEIQTDGEVNGSTLGNNVKEKILIRIDVKKKVVILTVVVGMPRQSIEQPKDTPPNCFTDKTYKKILKLPCFRFLKDEKSNFMIKWNKLRNLAYKFIEDKNFELFIIIMIVLSSISLALEDKFIHEKPRLKLILEYGDKVFAVIFTFEMILKWFAYGFNKYFSDGWCWLDFIIVTVSLLGIGASLLGYSDLVIFKTMRTLRALRPLRALSRFEGIRVVVNALLGSIPSIFNVMLVCLVFWLIFSIMGVQLFNGKFYKCIYHNLSRLDAHDMVQNRSECEAKGFLWSNSRINFDNVLNAYLALLQVATFKGWIEIMADASDIQDHNIQPKREDSLYMLLYFVFFIIFGSFFTLNLFIGVIIDNFNQQKKKLGNDSNIDIFLTDKQKKYLEAMKKMGNKKPQKALPRPKFPLARFFFDITSNQKFDIFIMVCIFLNMIAMCAENYDQTDTMESILLNINYIFIGIFTAESVMKLIALNWRYFKFPWNVFDFFIVLLSILGMSFESVIKNYLSVSPTILRVVRVARVGRVLRLVKGARGIRTLLFALAVSMPALINIGLLLFLIVFIYAIFGMNFFMYVGYGDYITKEFNFETILQSMITLFPLITSAGWSTTLDGLSNTEAPKCDPNANTGSQIAKGNCGNKAIAVPFLVTFVIITFLVVINMYIAVILENYNQAREEVTQGLTDDDYDMYYEIWQRYDPKCTQFISYYRLSDFLDSLESPLRIAKPNKIKIVSMNLAVCEDNQIHCVDILDALTKNYLAADEEIIDDGVQIDVKSERPRNYNPISNTLELQRKDYCAKIITKSFKKYINKKREQKKFQLLEDKSFEKASLEDISLDDYNISINNNNNNKNKYSKTENSNNNNNTNNKKDANTTDNHNINNNLSTTNSQYII